MSELNKDFAERLVALEQAVHTIRSELGHIREVVGNGYAALSDANDSHSKAIQIIARHIEQIEERLEPVFSNVFPLQEDFVRETQALFKRHGKE